MTASSTAAVASPPGAAAAPANTGGTFLDWIAGLTPVTPQGVALIEGARKLRDEIAARNETTPALDSPAESTRGLVRDDEGEDQ